MRSELTFFARNCFTNPSISSIFDRYCAFCSAESSGGGAAGPLPPRPAGGCCATALASAWLIRARVFMIGLDMILRVYGGARHWLAERRGELPARTSRGQGIGRVDPQRRPERGARRACVAECGFRFAQAIVCRG